MMLSLTLPRFVKIGPLVILSGAKQRFCVPAIIPVSLYFDLC
jgi:hypothetical protein